MNTCDRCKTTAPQYATWVIDQYELACRDCLTAAEILAFGLGEGRNDG